MIYHRHSLVGYMLWLRYGPLAGRPGLGLSDVYAHYLESPGTKAYSAGEAKKLFANFSNVRVRTLLGPGACSKARSRSVIGAPFLRPPRPFIPDRR
jgi:hypothetical protein